MITLNTGIVVSLVAFLAGSLIGYCVGTGPGHGFQIGDLVHNQNCEGRIIAQVNDTVTISQFDCGDFIISPAFVREEQLLPGGLE